jgi:hypothetical protein
LNDEVRHRVLCTLLRDVANQLPQFIPPPDDNDPGQSTHFSVWKEKVGDGDISDRLSRQCHSRPIKSFDFSFACSEHPHRHVQWLTDQMIMNAKVAGRSLGKRLHQVIESHGIGHLRSCLLVTRPIPSPTLASAEPPPRAAAATTNNVHDQVEYRDDDLTIDT